LIFSWKGKGNKKDLAPGKTPKIAKVRRHFADLNCDDLDLLFFADSFLRRGINGSLLSAGRVSPRFFYTGPQLEDKAMLHASTYADDCFNFFPERGRGSKILRPGKTPTNSLLSPWVGGLR
jgi:hypothetical protein